MNNKEIIKKMMSKAGVANKSQLAEYLSQKYETKIDRRQIAQYENSKSFNLVHILLREALEE